MDIGEEACVCTCLVPAFSLALLASGSALFQNTGRATTRWDVSVTVDRSHRHWAESRTSGWGDNSPGFHLSAVFIISSGLRYSEPPPSPIAWLVPGALEREPIGLSYWFGLTGRTSPDTSGSRTAVHLRHVLPPHSSNTDREPSTSTNPSAPQPDLRRGQRIEKKPRGEKYFCIHPRLPPIRGSRFSICLSPPDSSRAGNGHRGQRNIFPLKKR